MPTPAKKKTESGPTKAELLVALSAATGFPKTQVTAFFDALSDEVHRSLATSGVIVVPGLMKIRKVKIPAKPAHPGRNPATGETILIPAKPAQNVVRLRAVKALKDMV